MEVLDEENINVDYNVTDEENKLKIILLGDSAVGKSKYPLKIK